MNPAGRMERGAPDKDAIPDGFSSAGAPSGLAAEGRALAENGGGVRLFNAAVKCHVADILRGIIAPRLHSHPCWELQYIAAGTGTLYREGVGTEKIRPGMLCITLPGVLHRTTADGEEMVRYYADIEIPEGVLAPETGTLDTGQDTQLHRWFEDLVRLSRQGAGEQASALAALILLRVSGLECGGETGGGPHPLVRKAVNYIDLHFSSRIDLRAVAVHAGCSVSYLHSLFRTALGCAPIHYLNMRRIEQAKILLPAGFLTIAEVAEKCGFADPDYFCRKFKKITGATPSEYIRGHFRSLR